MPPSGGLGGGGQSGYGYPEYSDQANDMAAGYTATGYNDAGYDAAYDDEYPAQKPYPHPGESSYPALKADIQSECHSTKINRFYLTPFILYII